MVTFAGVTDGVVEGLCGPYTPATFTLQRAPVEGTLLVNYSVSYVNYDALGPDVPGSVTFGADDTTVTVPIEFSRNISGFIVHIEPGEGYQFLPSDRAAFPNVQGDPFCPYPLYLSQVESNLRQTIHVGERPAPFVMVDDGLTLERRAPEVHSYPDGLTFNGLHWEGAATAPGEYFIQFFCSNCERDHGDFVFQLTVTGKAPLPRTDSATGETLPRTGSATVPAAILGCGLVAGGLVLCRISGGNSRAQIEG